MLRASLLSACALAVAAPAGAASLESVVRARIAQRAGIDLVIHARPVQATRPWPAKLSPLRASVDLTGEKDDIVSLNIPQALQLAGASGSDRVRLGLRHDLANGALVMASGEMRLHVVGTVEADINQTAPGLYRGVLVIIAQFN